MTFLMGLKPRLYLAKLYLITDARSANGDLESFVDAAFCGGVQIIQLRDPGLSQTEELAALKTIRDVANEHQGMVVVNGSAQLAAKFKADLLHLGPGNEAPSAARLPLGKYALIGQSTHSPTQVRAALADDQVNYFTVGPVYSDLVNTTCPIPGLNLLRAATELAPPKDAKIAPWFAVGGINRRTAAQALAAGARRLVVDSAISAAPNPEDAALELTELITKSWEADPAMADFTGQTLSIHGI